MKINFAKILVVFTTVLFFSCTVEPVDSVLAEQAIANSGGNTNTNTNTNNQVIDYWPSVINNSWTYDQNGTTQTPMKIISTEIVNGETYYNFDNIFGQSPSASANVSLKLRKNQGEYFLKMPSFTVDFGGGLSAQASEIEYLIFKDYVNVNDTWTSNYSQTFTYNNPLIPATTVNAVVDGTMLEKNSAITINGVTFNNVIKFKLVQSANVQGQITTTTTFYWFAKGVGCVKTITQNAGSPDSIMELKTYTLF